MPLYSDPGAFFALGMERTRFMIVFSRDRAPQSAQSWGLGPPPSTCAHDYVLAFLASPPQKMRKGRFCVKRVLLFLRGGNLPFPRKLRETLPSFSFLWNVIRLPVTRSVGLKGQGGPGVSETRGGARGVICRRHEAPPRVTERPSETLRLRHPGSPAPNKKDPHQLVFVSLLSRAVVGGKVFVWRPACGRQRCLLWADPQDVRSRAHISEQRSRGSPLSCM